jgi:hypothetical protein
MPCIGVCGKRPDEMNKYGFSIKHFRQCSIDYAALIAPQPFDIFPVLRYLPDSFGMARWKEKARSVRKGVFDCGAQFLSAAGEQRQASDAGKTNGSESMLASMLREQRDNNDQTFTTADIGNTAFHVVTAGSGTSLAFMSVVLMILAKYPEAQTRLREEVLRKTSNLPPAVSDIADLKYMDAVWNEVCSLMMPIRYHKLKRFFLRSTAGVLSHLKRSLERHPKTTFTMASTSPKVPQC